MRIGLYGGSFDPPHVAHVMAVHYALMVGNLDMVWVLPCWDHSFGKEMTPYHQRVEMARHAFGDFDPGVVTISSLEGAIQATCTWDLLEYLKVEQPHNDFVLIIGEDNWRDRHEWKHWDAVNEALAGIIVVGRQGVEGGGGVSGIQLPDISSTQARRAVRDGDWVLLTTIVPSGVLSYIDGFSLYRDNPVPEALANLKEVTKP